MKQSISKKKTNIKEIFSLFAVMLFFQIIVLMYQNDKNSSNNDAFLMEQCWTDENGNTVSVTSSPAYRGGGFPSPTGLVLAQ